MSDIPTTIIYVDNAPENPCDTCILSDHCPTHEEDRCDDYKGDD